MSATILLVDDHEANRKVLRRRLERRGYQVTEAEDGDEAVSKFCSSPPSLVLMDLSMPNVSGMDAFQQIRESGIATSVPVVALTAHATSAMREKCLQIGFAGFYTKPIDFEALALDVAALTGKAA